MFKSPRQNFLHTQRLLTSNQLHSQLYHNAERVRTCNSYNKHIPGLYASVNNSTNSSDNQIIGYISNAGIPSIAFIKLQELDVATPYAAFPLILVDQQMGLKWWKNMVDGKRMQSMLPKIGMIKVIPIFFKKKD